MIYSQASDHCWFCQNRPASGTPLDVELSHQGSKEIIWVPRCADCEAVHRRNTRLTLWGSLISSLMIIGLTIIAVVLSSKAAGGWAWGIGVVVFLAGMLGSVKLMVYIIKQLTAKAGTHLSPYSYTYPAIKAKVEKGWQITKQGTAKGNPPQEQPSASENLGLHPHSLTEESKKRANTAEEVKRRYQQGERNFKDIVLVEADLSWTDLSEINLENACLAKANLKGATLTGANLRGADLREADLYGATLRGADLHSANLQGANLAGAFVIAANLSAANLYGANLNGIRGLNGANLAGATLPDGSKDLS